MKRRLIASLIALSALLPLGQCPKLRAQTEQRVLVLEYQGKEAKTPLAYAEVAVSGAASATSDAQGQLTLRFRSAHAGDAVKVRRVALAGYEVFNIEALEQWAISPNVPFTIVLCQSDKFRALCEQYSSVASQSYQQQLQHDRERLAALRHENKLKEEEYQQELQTLQDQYDQQLEDLDRYVNHFARFDLSELSAEEQQIIALVQEGKIDEAISRYEAMDLLGQYRQQSREIRAIASAQDSLQQLRENKEAAIDTLKAIQSIIDNL